MSVNFDEYIERIKAETDIFMKARLMEHLIQKKGIKVKTIAKNLELSSSYVCNMLRALKLPELIRDGFYARLVSPTHLFVLSRLKNHDDMITMYEETLAKSYSTTDLEERVREMLHSVETTGERVDPNVVDDVVAKIKSIDPDVTVKVIQTRVKSRIFIEKKGNFEETSEYLEKVSKSI